MPLVRLLALLIPMLSLPACAAPLSYAAVQATARIAGCWPDPYPTPRAVTVTPSGTQTALPPGAIPPGMTPTAAFPTTTPYPRCTPLPDATPIPWPPPVPPPPAYPTMQPRRWLSGSAAMTTLRLPHTVLGIDLAAHPTEGWPALAAVVWSGNDDPERVLLSVYQPATRAWSSARQVDVGESRLGRYVRTAQVAVTGAGEVVAVWGMSDPDFRDNDPPSGVWSSASRDFGVNWSIPQRVATDCKAVNDLAASLDGWLAALLICNDGPNASRPAIVIRQPDGVWRAPELLPFQSWYYSAGALAITGSGEQAKVTGLVLSGQNELPLAFLVGRNLASAEPWQVQTRPITAEIGRLLTPRMWYARALAYDRTLPDGTTAPALTFSWTESYAGGAFALTSLDGGASWGEVEVITAPANPAELISFAAPAYDPTADRLTAIWTCCGYDQWTVNSTTHFASWSVPGSGVWFPAGRTAADTERVPLITGSHSVFETVTAQAAGSRITWLAWVEQQQRVEVRSLDLNQIIPAGEYREGDNQ